MGHMIQNIPLSATTLALSQKYSLYFAALFIAVLVIAIPLPRSLAVLPGVLGTGGFLAFYAVHKYWPAIDKPLLALCALTLFFGAISSLWAEESGYVLTRAAKTSALLIPGVALLAMASLVSQNNARKSSLVQTCAITIGIGGFVFAVEYACGLRLTRLLLGIGAGEAVPAGIESGFMLNRGMVFLSLFAMPTLLALYASALVRRTKILLGAFMLAGLLAALSVTQSQTAQIALLFFFLMLLYPSNNKTARRALLAVLLAGVLLAPLLPPAAHRYILEMPIEQREQGFIWQASIPHRLEVWNFVAEKIAEKPVIGHGMDSTRFFVSAEPMHYMKKNTVLHPHNAILQLWVEFGMFGAALAAGLLVLLFNRLDAMHACLQRYYMAMMIVMLGVLSMGYGLWQAWQLGMIFAIPAFSIMVTRLYPEEFTGKSSESANASAD